MRLWEFLGDSYSIQLRFLYPSACSWLSLDVVSHAPQLELGKLLSLLDSLIQLRLKIRFRQDCIKFPGEIGSSCPVSEPADLLSRAAAE